MSTSLGEIEDGIGAVDDLLLTPFFHITKEQRKPVCNMEKNEADADMASESKPGSNWLDP